MLIETAGALGRAFISVFGSETDETPLVRMFRIEYPSEYMMARKNGVYVDHKFVSEYFKTQKSLELVA